MEEELVHQRIIEKLNGGMPFGLFEEGKKCYFQDGERVHYNDLWKAVRLMHRLEDGHVAKPLVELCPDTFAGVFPGRFSKGKFKKISVTKNSI